MKGHDPMLTKLYDTIRQVRQARRRELAAFRNYAEAQEAIDNLVCEGEIIGDGRRALHFDYMRERWIVEIDHI